MRLVTRTGMASRCGALLLTAAAALSLTASARADNIDQELEKRASDVLKQLQQRGYQNVGVLKFMVKKGKSEPSFSVGAMNHNLATRLENALILADDPAKPLGVIRDATSVAAHEAPKANYGTAAGREQLLKLSYPLAWGSKKVSADAFLTGSVELSVDMKQTTVNLLCFDRKSAKLDNLVTFSVKTDRSILSDCGQSYMLAKRSLNTRDANLDEEAANNSAIIDGQPNPPPGGNNSILDTYVKVDIKYDNNVQSITPDSASGGEFKTGDPKPGQKIEFTLSNLSDQRIGVVLKINGKSTFNMEEEENDRCALWVLEPKGMEKSTGNIKGFYNMEAKTFDEFKALSDEESVSAFESLKRGGYIDVIVFTEAAATDELQLSLRGLSKRGLAKTPPPATVADAKKVLRQTMDGNVKRALKQRGLIEASGTTVTANLTQVQFNNPQAAGEAHIQYYVKP